MLGTIVLHEIQEHLKSMKLQIGFILVISLIILSTIVNISDYTTRQQDSLNAKISNQDSNGIRDITVFKQPHVLSVLVRGKEGILGNKASMDSYHIPANTTSYSGELGRTKNSTIFSESFDYLFITRTILSVLLIFLVYDAISGEKVQGTLKQALSNNIPRHIILFGKLIGGMAVVETALFAATLCTMLIMMVHPSVQLGSEDIVRILFMFLAVSMYLLFFYTAGLWISVIFNRPSLALTFLLQFWIILLFIIPNLSVFIADTTYTLPDEAERLYQSDLIGRKQVTNLDIKKLNQYETANLGADFYYKYDKEYDNELNRQFSIAQNIAIFSPSVLFDNIMSCLACTGIEEHQRFIDGLYQYWDATFRFKSNDTTESYRKRIISPSSFLYTSDSINQSLLRILPKLFVLILLDIIFFSLAFISFLRKDVR
jgi:ABC-type transport system involved in multi-copper enzyme maturation permease subunit